MAEQQKKYVDLNGLSYTVRKINTLKADIESPDFSGTPTSPTAEKGTKTTQIATTEFVDTAIADYVEKKNYVTDTEIQEIIDEILDGEGTPIDKVTFEQLVARVEALEALIRTLLQVNVDSNSLVFTKE